ncbi:hypothetical protein [Mesobacillus foraminis]|nr:hypothetical protein [Mesobacillus foraminis]
MTGWGGIKAAVIGGGSSFTPELAAVRLITSIDNEPMIRGIFSLSIP